MSLKVTYDGWSTAWYLNEIWIGAFSYSMSDGFWYTFSLLNFSPHMTSTLVFIFIFFTPPTRLTWWGRVLRGVPKNTSFFRYAFSILSLYITLTPNRMYIVCIMLDINYALFSPSYWLGGIILELILLI